MIRMFRKAPLWGWGFGLLYFALQYGMYRLADLLGRITGTIERAFVPKIPRIDDRIPVVAVFAVIYLFSYVFWILGPVAVSVTKKRNFVNYITGLSLAYLIGFLIFWIFPSCMDREAEGLMLQASRPGFFPWLLSIIYGADGAGKAFNLFPSYHCLISLYCYLGVRKQEEIPKGFRIYSLIMTVLICLSTVFTKQHYFLDIPGGLLISLGCYLLVRKLDPGRKFE